MSWQAGTFCLTFGFTTFIAAIKLMETHLMVARVLMVIGVGLMLAWPVNVLLIPSTPMLSISCKPETLPLHGKHQESLNVAYLHPKWGNQVGLFMFGSEGPDAYWPTINAAGVAYQCTIVNISSYQIAFLFIPFSIKFEKAEQAQRSWTMQVPITAGLAPNDRFVVHLYDNTGWSPEVAPAKTVSGRLLGEEGTRELLVEHGTKDGLPYKLRSFGQ